MFSDGFLFREHSVSSHQRPTMDNPDGDVYQAERILDHKVAKVIHTINNFSLYCRNRADLRPRAFYSIAQNWPI